MATMDDVKEMTAATFPSPFTTHMDWLDEQMKLLRAWNSADRQLYEFGKVRGGWRGLTGATGLEA